MNPRNSYWMGLLAGGIALAGAMGCFWPNRTDRSGSAATALAWPKATPIKNIPAPLVPAGHFLRFGRDYCAYIAELRSRGVAESRIREIITNELRGRYRREQYRTELLIEQARYPRHYWESSPSIEMQYELERYRQDGLAQLDQELNATLKGLFGDGAVLPSARVPLFGPENPGPKMDFLPATSQARLAEALLAQDPDGRMSSVDRLNLAGQLLTPDEFELYAKWNSPYAVALGSQLVGFQPGQAEYDAIYRWQSIAGSEQGFPSAEARAEADHKLEAALGAGRYAAFEHLQDPGYQTVVQVLNRWSLPLTQADTVLSLRQSATSAMDAIWQDANTPDDQKPALVEKVRQQFRQQITDKLGLPAGLVPDDDLL
jgi:hypothetical protein